MSKLAALKAKKSVVLSEKESVLDIKKKWFAQNMSDRGVLVVFESHDFEMGMLYIRTVVSVSSVTIAGIEVTRRGIGVADFCYMSDNTGNAVDFDGWCAGIRESVRSEAGGNLRAKIASCLTLQERLRLNGVTISKSDDGVETFVVKYAGGSSSHPWWTPVPEIVEHVSQQIARYNAASASRMALDLLEEM